MQRKILLIHHDTALMKPLENATESGLAIQTLSPAHVNLDAIQKIAPDLAVIQYKMESNDGFQVMRRLQECLSVPVIFLGDEKSDSTDEILALRGGADFFMYPPYSMRLLRERITTILRRYEASKNKSAFTESVKPVRIITVGDLEMDPERFLVRWQGQPVTLTVGEFRLLSTLAKNPGITKNRYDLSQAMESEVRTDERTIDSHIKRIRYKLKSVDPIFDEIQSVYGAGYRYRALKGSAMRPEIGASGPSKPQI